MSSSLHLHLAKPALTDGQLLALAARAWHELGIALLKPEHMPDPFDRQAVVNAADKLYGKRANGNA